MQKLCEQTRREKNQLQRASYNLTSSFTNSPVRVPCHYPFITRTDSSFQNRTHNYNQHAKPRKHSLITPSLPMIQSQL